MKLIEKFALIIYSLIIFILSIIICLFIFGIIDMESINNCLKMLKQNQSATIIAISASVFLILLSVRCLIFRKRKQIKKSEATDILLENDDGRLLISKQAIENAVQRIIDDRILFDKNTQVTIDIDPANNISIYIIVFLEEAVKVRDLTIGLQLDVKNKIKENFDLDVKQVNIKVDNMNKAQLKDLKKVEEQKAKVNKEDTTENKEVIEIKPENNTNN